MIEKNKLGIWDRERVIAKIKNPIMINLLENMLQPDSTKRYTV